MAFFWNFFASDVRWYDPQRWLGARVPPELLAWLKRSVTIGTVDGKEQVTAVQVVDDFAPVQPFLMAPDPYGRLNALMAFLILAMQPANVPPIIALVREFILVGGPEAAPEHSPGSREAKDWESLLETFDDPPWVRHVGLPIQELRMKGIFLLYKLLDTFCEEEPTDPAAEALWQQAAAVLEEVMRTAEAPAFRLMAAKLLEDGVYFAGELARWGDAEGHLQPLLQFAQDPREMPELRAVAFIVLRRTLKLKEGELHVVFPSTWGHEEAIRLLRLFLAFLWEVPESAQWDLTSDLYASPVSRVLLSLLNWRAFLPPADYTRLLDLLRKAIAYPLPPIREAPPPHQRHPVYGERPLVGWYLIKDTLAGVLATSFRSEEEKTRLLDDLIQTPADLELYQQAREWMQRVGSEATWERQLARLQAKFANQPED